MEDPRDVFFFKFPEGYYRAICLYNGVVAERCPNNERSICKIRSPELPRNKYHDWDGKNAWKCLCG